MAKLVGSGVHLFRLFGIDVFVHWSWAVVALLEIEARRDTYQSLAWNVAEYVALFAVVLMHEFGHALACRSVGGKAERIMLWPLGGVAYVSPPPRPGALLWSIAAGPLVNLVLLVLATGPLVLAQAKGVPPDVAHFVSAFWAINLVLLVFNLLPVYPLDGGQILQALLWFVIGRARSLMVVSVIGLCGAAAVMVLAVVRGSIWWIAMALFAGLRAFNGLKVARLLAATVAAPRRDGFACPACGAPPPLGAFWRCACGAEFDTFATGGACPRCSRRFATTSCPACHRVSPHEAFYPRVVASPAQPPPGVPNPS
jgi:Zn-dependent protease